MKRILLMVTAGVSILILSGCGGGGEIPTPTKTCDMIVPDWTGKTMSIASIEDGKKALTPIMQVIDRQTGYLNVEKSVDSLQTSGEPTKEMSVLYDKLRSGDWIVRKLRETEEGDALVKESLALEVDEYNCSYGGKVITEFDSGMTETGNWELRRYIFKNCVEDSKIVTDLLEGLFFDPTPTDYTLLTTDTAESNSTVTFNGTLELNTSSQNTMPGYFIIASVSTSETESDVNQYVIHFAAEDFSIELLDKSDPEREVRGYLGANIGLTVQETESPDAYDLTLTTHGCAALNGTEAGEEVINVNFTADNALLEYNWTSVDENQTDYRFVFDGYAGLSGILVFDKVVDQTEADTLNFGLYQFHAEDFTVQASYFDDLKESNVTLGGRLGSSCMAGNVDYNGTFTEGFDEDGDLSTLEGNITLNGNEGVLLFDRTGMTLTVGEESLSSDDPRTFMDENCSTIYDEIISFFEGFFWAR